jgi:RNA polymerase sigma-70 factor (ECF subfamily)
MVGRAAVLLAHDTGDVERDPPLLQKNWWLMEMNWSDGELVRRIGLGPDAVAEAGLFDRMAPRIRLYGLRHLRDRDAAEDLVQNVLIVTLEALRAGRLREGDRLASFVLGVCRMTVLDLRRNAQRRSELLGRFGAGVAVALPEAMPSLDRNQLAACLKTLRERERAVVVLTFYDEKSSMDVSRFLGVSEANVRVMRHRAIHQLRDCMGGAT